MLFHSTHLNFTYTIEFYVKNVESCNRASNVIYYSFHSIYAIYILGEVKLAIGKLIMFLSKIEITFLGNVNSADILFLHC